MMMMKSFVTPAAALFCLCGVSSPSLADPSPDGAVFVAAMDEFCAALERLCRICSGIRDKASADAAAELLLPAFLGMNEKHNKLKVLPKNKLNEKDNAALKSRQMMLDKLSKENAALLEKLKNVRCYGSTKLVEAMQKVKDIK